MLFFLCHLVLFVSPSEKKSLIMRRSKLGLQIKTNDLALAPRGPFSPISTSPSDGLGPIVISQHKIYISPCSKLNLNHYFASRRLLADSLAFLGATLACLNIILTARLYCRYNPNHC